MKFATTGKILAIGLALLILVFEAMASDPIFVKWLVMDDPGDETIYLYWERAEAGELSPEELVDLGTMLFYRGWPNDAVGYFHEAAKLDPELSDAWFRIGLVKHYGGDLSGARSAYKKCLKKQSGHAWANFYLGLLEEQTGEGKAAMQHFETAFKHAPELADPRVNPEILSSKLQLGAQVRYFDSERFEKSMPMPFLEPATVRNVKQQAKETPTPIPTPEPVVVEPTPALATPTPVPARASESRSKTSAARRSTGSSEGASGGGSTSAGARSGGGASESLPDTESTESMPFGFPEPTNHGATGAGGGSGRGGGGASPRIGETSPDAKLRPLWPGLYQLIDAIV